MLTKASVRPNVVAASKHFAFGFVFASLMASVPQIAAAQTASVAAGLQDFAPAMIDHMQKMRRYKDPHRGVEHILHVIDRFRVDHDPKGAIASFQPNGRRLPGIMHSSRIWGRMAEAASPVIGRRTAGV